MIVRAGAAGSYEGVHFIVIERSAIQETVNGVVLKDYYTIETPGTAAFPKDSDDNDLDTFVNFLQLDAIGTKERVDKIKNEVKSFDPTIDDRIFQKLVEILNVKFHDTKLQEALDTYLDNQYAASLFNQEQSENQLWGEWIEYLEIQNDLRAKRLVPESYIADFRNGNDFDWSAVFGG